MAVDLEKYRKKPTTATTTKPVDLSKYKKATTTAPTSTPPTEPSKPGFFKSLLQSVASPVTKTLSSLAPVAESVYAGLSPNFSHDDISRRNQEGRDFGAFGQNVKPFGSQFGLIQSGEKTPLQAGVDTAKDVVGNAANAASLLIPTGKIPAIAKTTAKGAILRGIGQGGKAGAISGMLGAGGTELTKEDSTVGSVAKETAKGGATGLVLGGLIGGAGASLGKTYQTGKNVKSGQTSSNIMQRVARTNALDQEKFKKTAGESVGEYLVKRGIYGTDDEIVVKLADRFTRSKSVADEALAKLPGTHKNGVVDDIVEELLAREKRISTKNVPSRDLAKVEALKVKNDSVGLSMPEVNELKRLYERNVKLGYLKENNADAVARSTNLDDNLRKWQFDTAKKLGLKNLDEINRETRLARKLGDDLFKKMNRSGGNNAFGLTDAILISGGDPQAITMLLTKKTLGSKGVQSAIAQKLAPKASVGVPVAKFTQGLPKQLPQQSQPKVLSTSLPLKLPPKASTSTSLSPRKVNDAKIKEIFGELPPKASTISSKTKAPFGNPKIEPERYAPDVRDTATKFRENSKNSQLNASKFSGGNKEYAGRVAKGIAMKDSATLRLMRGEPTPTELQKAIGYLNSNHVGKKVKVAGQDGIVQGTAFGKIRVRLPDGTTKSFDLSEITANKATKEEATDYLKRGATNQAESWNKLMDRIKKSS